MRVLPKTLAVAAATTLLVGSATAAFAVGNTLVNGDYEVGAPGDTTIAGWTAVNTRIDLGVTQIAGCTTVDTSDYTTLRDWDIEYQNTYGGWNQVQEDEFGNPVLDGNGDPIPLPVPLDPDPTVNNDSAETLDEELYTVTIRDGNVLEADGDPLPADFLRDSQVLELFSDVSGTDKDGYVVHGPAVYSDVFAAKTIDDLEFDWAASDASDDYHVLGYLLNVDTCEQTEVIDSTGESSVWQTAAAAVPSNGNYRFVFVSGTFDQSFGGAAGAFLYLDNASVVVNEERAAAEAAAAEAAQLAKTGSDLTLAGIAGAALVALGGVTLLIRRRNAHS